MPVSRTPTDPRLASRRALDALIDLVERHNLVCEPDTDAPVALIRRACTLGVHWGQCQRSGGDLHALLMDHQAHFMGRLDGVEEEDDDPYRRSPVRPPKPPRWTPWWPPR